MNSKNDLLKRLLHQLRDEKLFKNDFERALQVAEKIEYLLKFSVRPNPELKNELYYRKGYLLLKLGRFEEGIKTLQKVEENSSYYIDAVATIADYFCSKGETKLCKEYLDKFKNLYKERFSKLLAEGRDHLIAHRELRYYQHLLENLLFEFQRLETGFLVLKGLEIKRIQSEEINKYTTGDYIFLGKNPIKVINGKTTRLNHDTSHRRAALLLSLEPFNLVDRSFIAKIYGLGGVEGRTFRNRNFIHHSDPSLRSLYNKDLQRLKQEWKVELEPQTLRVLNVKVPIIVPCKLTFKVKDLPKQTLYVCPF
jgi:tetratricopeptide (TPR) repeat protein